MRTSRGVSLIELLAVMSACTVILSVSATLIHRTMQAQSQTRYFFENERSALRLTRQFRRDVHDATVFNSLRSKIRRGEELNIEERGIEERGQVHFLRLERPGDQSTTDVIEYRRHPTAIERTVSRNGTVVSREKYSISSIARLTLREADAPRRLVLTITADPADLIPQQDKPAPTIRDAPVSLEVVALISRDAPFTAATNIEEETP